MASVRWLTAFIDLPPDRFAAGSAFWLGATATELSGFRGPDASFATLIPVAGDAHLRVQRLAEPEGRIHLDLHVDDVGSAVDEAVALGATERHRDGHAVLASPGGLVFCLVDHHGEAEIAPPAADPHPCTVDQICLDVPASRFDDEVAFWSTLTGWPPEQAVLQEFTRLTRPAGSPMRLLLQRLGPDDAAESTRAHLDLSAGDHVEALAAHHGAQGAEVLGVHRFWTVMRDPAGLVYCLTRRDPATGSLPG